MMALAETGLTQLVQWDPRVKPCSPLHPYKVIDLRGIAAGQYQDTRKPAIARPL